MTPYQILLAGRRGGKSFYREHQIMTNILDDMTEVLRDVDDFVDNYADVEDGPGGFPRANDAMQLQSRVKEMIKRIERITVERVGRASA